MAQYPAAFSTNKFDTGVFRYFEVELDATPGSSVIEKERVVKPHIVAELKPLQTPRMIRTWMEKYYLCYVTNDLNALSRTKQIEPF